MFVKCDNPVEVAKEAFWLAWKACGGPTGMGVFRDNPAATRDSVWRSVSGQEVTDYIHLRGEEQRPYGDYVFGRMMKLGMDIKEDGIEIRDGEPRQDYQSWCGTYKTYAALIEAAIESAAKESKR